MRVRVSPTAQRRSAKAGLFFVIYASDVRYCPDLVVAQRKIPVVLHFLHHRHKAGGASPLGVARAACFEQLAGHCQLRCPALRKDLSQSEDKERYIPDTSELRSERLYFRIE